MGHTTPDAEYYEAGTEALPIMLAGSPPETVLYPTLNGIRTASIDGGSLGGHALGVHSNEFTLPSGTLARLAKKSSSNHANLGRAGHVLKASNSYNAATVR